MSFEKDIKNILEGREKVQAVPRPDNKDRKEIENVGRPDSAEPTSDKSTYTRTAEIYRKVIEDKETTMERLSTKKLFEKVLDVIEEKKGKTEVDLNPKTNPSVMDGEDYNKKKKPMKESNNDTNIDTVNRVAADLVRMTKEKEPKKLPHVNDPGVPDMFKIKEGLKGNQHKIARVADPKDKITSADFKKLRGEEVEQVDELDRNQGSIINRYIRKTTDDPKRKVGRDLALKKKWGDKNYGTDEPKVKAVQREEAENIEEKKVNAYAVGMAQAMKATGDEPPLEKSTIKKAHKIAKAVKREDVEFSKEEINHIANVLETAGVDAHERQSNSDMIKNQKIAMNKRQKEKNQVARAKEAQRKKEDLLKQQAQNQSYEPDGDMIEAVKNSIQNLMKNPDAPFNGVNRGAKAKDAGLTHITDGKKK